MVITNIIMITIKHLQTNEISVFNQPWGVYMPLDKRTMYKIMT